MREIGSIEACEQRTKTHGERFRRYNGVIFISILVHWQCDRNYHFMYAHEIAQLKSNQKQFGTRLNISHMLCMCLMQSELKK